VCIAYHLRSNPPLRVNIVFLGFLLPPVHQKALMVVRNHLPTSPLPMSECASFLCCGPDCVASGAPCKSPPPGALGTVTLLMLCPCVVFKTTAFSRQAAQSSLPPQVMDSSSAFRSNTSANRGFCHPLLLGVPSTVFRFFSRDGRASRPYLSFPWCLEMRPA